MLEIKTIDTTVGAGDSGKTGGDKINDNFAAVAQEFVEVRGLATSAASAAVAPIQEALSDWANQTPTFFDNASLGATGQQDLATTGYRYATLVLPASVASLRVTATVVGSSTARKLAYYYSDTSFTTLLGTSAQGGSSGAGTLYSNEVLTLPAGTVAVKINGTMTAPITVDARMMLTGVGARLTAAEAAAASASTLATPAANALLETIKASPTYNNNMRLELNGTTTAATNYTNSLLVLAAGVKSIKLTSTVVGTGNPLLVWYSSQAGTAVLSVGTERGGASGTAYTNQVFAVPAGAQAVRVAGTSTAPTTLWTIQPAAAVADRVATLEGYGTAEISTALYAYQPQTITTVLNAVTNADGTVTNPFNGYAYGQIALTGAEKGVRATGNVVGTGRYLATYYADTACTQFISREKVGSSGGTLYTDELLTVPPTARGLRINSGVTSPLGVKFYAIDPAIGEKVRSIGSTASNWKGKKWASFGDSVTEMGRWQVQLGTYLELGVHTNCGIGGTTVSKPDVAGKLSMCDDVRINAIPADSKLILFMGLTNDWGQSRALGTLQSWDVDVFDTNTVYGALETVAVKLLARFNAGQAIVWMTPVFGNNQSRVTASIWTSAYYNTIGLYVSDYAKAMIQVARKYGFPVIDLPARLGWNKQNAALYFDAENGDNTFIHPNVAKGGPAMAAVMADDLRGMNQLAALVS